MNFDVVISKIEERQYDTLEAFQEDVDLIFYNAIIYNKAETPYARLAWKLRKLCQEVYIPNATESLTSLDMDAGTGMIRDTVPDELFAYPYMDPSWPIVMAAPPPPAYQRRAVTPSIQELDGGTVKGTVISSRSAPRMCG